MTAPSRRLARTGHPPDHTVTAHMKGNVLIIADGWVVRPRTVSAPRLRMFCFAYAGGSASVFNAWPDHLPDDIEVCAVQLPGHETRIAEPAYTDISRLVPALAKALDGLLHDLPFVTFGHSMGATVSFELVRYLRSIGAPQPRLMFIAGRRPPHIDSPDVIIHDLPDQQLIQAVAQLNGTPQEFLREKDLLRLILPMLRADFAVIERYRHEPGPPLDMPLVALTGAGDVRVSRDVAAQWAQYTANSFTLRILPGDHFFLRSAMEQLLAEITHHLALPRDGAARS